MSSTRSTSLRAAFGGIVLLLLALRLLSPAGFMPAFDHGAVTIVACPDYEPASLMAHHHHHGDSKTSHQHCPYASVSVAGALANFVLIAAALLFAARPLLGRTFRFLDRHNGRDRPQPRGPPLPV